MDTKIREIWFVCLYPINVKTPERIWLIFFVATHTTPGIVNGWLKVKHFTHGKNINKKIRNRSMFTEKGSTFRVLQRRKNGRLKGNAELVVRWGINRLIMFNY